MQILLLISILLEIWISAVISTLIWIKYTIMISEMETQNLLIVRWIIPVFIRWILFNIILCCMIRRESWKREPLQRWNILVWTMETKGFFSFEIIINVSVSLFFFIWMPMSWVYGHYKFVILSARGPSSSKDGPRAERVISPRFDYTLAQRLPYNLNTNARLRF